MNKPEFLDFEGMINVRDLGGLPVSGGRRIRSGVLLRSAHLSMAMDNDLQRLRQLGLKYVVDFRDIDEAAHSPDRDVIGAEHVALPVLDPERVRVMSTVTPLSTEQVAEHFRDIYRYMALAERARQGYRKFFSVLLDARGGAVLWHCTQGKDRTGIGALLLLAALGADSRDALADYYLSNRGLLSEYRRVTALGDAAQTAMAKKVFFVHGSFLRAWLDEVEALGGVAEFLRSAIGLTDGEVRQLREYYTE
ncbi:MAG: tyrosine-protein phosphatase [Oscillospiraceae bacterium]|nr:tyrosine-protein phosphatase [Oscillospiraceae bacterium]